MLKGIADVAAAAAAQAEEESNAPQHEPLLQSTAPEEEDYVKHLLIDVQSHSRFFRGFVEDVPALAQLLSIVEYEEGETILQRGEEGTASQLALCPWSLRSLPRPFPFPLPLPLARLPRSRARALLLFGP